jgi:tetratricopeptide (TPR) repeat protein
MSSQPTLAIQIMSQTETIPTDAHNVPARIATVDRFRSTRSEYHDSFEEPEAFRLKTHFGQVFVWRVKGRVAQIWDRLSVSLKTLLPARESEFDEAYQSATKNGHVGPRDPRWLLRCFLFGVDKEHARPHVTILCDTEWCSNALKNTIIKSKILVEKWGCVRLPYPVMQLGRAPEWASNSEDFEKYKIHAFETGQDNYHSGSLFEVKIDGVTQGAATIGGVVEVGGLLLGMTCGHVFHPQIQHPPSIGFPMDEKELDLFAYGSNAEDSTGHLLDTIQLASTETIDDNEKLEEEYASPAKAKPEFCVGHLEEISRDMDEESQGPLGRLLLDWALVAVDRSHRQLLERKIMPSPSSFEEEDTDPLSRVSDMCPDNSMKVVINAPSKNFIQYNGFGTGSTAVLHIPGSSRLQTVHICVMIDHSEFKKGDCGSWAFEDKLNPVEVKFLGMLVAACSALKEAYLLPADAILEDIEKRSGQLVEIPTGLPSQETATSPAEARTKRHEFDKKVGVEEYPFCMTKLLQRAVEIQIWQSVMSTFGSDHKRWGFEIRGHAVDLYQPTDHMDNLEAAIANAKRTVAATPLEDLNRAAHLNNLGVLLYSWYTRTGDTEYLERAFELKVQSVETSTDMLGEAHSTTLSSMDNLALTYMAQGRWRKAEELEVRVVEMSKTTLGKEHPATLNSMNNLALVLSRQGKYADAIAMHRQALEGGEKALGPEHPDTLTGVNHLGSVGQQDDLDEDYATRLNKFRNILSLQYGHTGAMEGREKALRPEHPDTLTGVNHLGSVGQQDDLNEDYATRLNNFGNILSLQYGHTGAMEDLEEAIRVARQAIAARSRNHPDFATMLNNLAFRLSSRYERTERVNDLHEAARLAARATRITHDDHPALAAILSDLGSILSRLYDCKEALDTLDWAVQVFKRAWGRMNATPLFRLRASTYTIRFLQIMQTQQQFEHAYYLAVDAIDLLPYVHHQSLDHWEQQYVVAHFSGLATTACSLALHTGKDPEVALEVLERGRGAILSLLMDDRGGTSELNTTHPEVYTRYKSLLVQVNKSIKDFKYDHTALAQLEECVHSIQQLPGFGQFHKGPNAEQMQTCSKKGHIVVVNITDLRSDAIAVTAGGFKTLPLSGLTADRAKAWIRNDLTTSSRSDRGRKNRAYLQFLSWLWRECVRPVLDELNCHAQPSADDLPRIWWIGTGLASTFPFHAAGDFRAGIAESTFSRAISSYAPTVKALQRSQERSTTTTSILSRHDPLRALIVTMPTILGADSLEGTEKEKAEVADALGPSVSIESLEHPDAASTMAQLQTCDIAHFACHGITDPTDPSKSGLILQKADTETGDLQQDILSVQAVSQTRPFQAEIAYLFASSTAQNKATGLSDEVLHVVSGFQVAGFRHVVGCLWPSDDTVSAEVAKSFYATLFQDRAVRGDNGAGIDEEGDDDRAVALALHKAVIKIKESEEYRNKPLSWAQYVHFGA